MTFSTKEKQNFKNLTKKHNCSLNETGTTRLFFL